MSAAPATGPSPRRRLAAALAGASLVLVACGGDDDPPDATPAATAAPDTTAEPTATEPTATEPAATEPAADDGEAADEVDVVDITIAEFAFNGPDEVPVGTTVRITNLDAVQHTWTAVDGSFDSGTLAVTETFEYTFDEPGEFAFVCSIHPSMEGSITVTG